MNDSFASENPDYQKSQRMTPDYISAFIKFNEKYIPVNSYSEELKKDDEIVFLIIDFTCSRSSQAASSKIDKYFVLNKLLVPGHKIEVVSVVFDLNNYSLNVGHSEVLRNMNVDLELEDLNRLKDLTLLIKDVDGIYSKNDTYNRITDEDALEEISVWEKTLPSKLSYY